MPYPVHHPLFPETTENVKNLSFGPPDVLSAAPGRVSGASVRFGEPLVLCLLFLHLVALVERVGLVKLLLLLVFADT